MDWILETTGRTWTKNIFKKAAAAGHVHILSYGWDQQNREEFKISLILKSAISGVESEPWNEGSLRSLKWLLKKKFRFPLTEGIFFRAAHRDDNKILRWIIIHGKKLFLEDETLRAFLGQVNVAMTFEEFDNVVKFCLQ
jgi:hypothetical protein